MKSLFIKITSMKSVVHVKFKSHDIQMNFVSAILLNCKLFCAVYALNRGS